MESTSCECSAIVLVFASSGSVEEKVTAPSSESPPCFPPHLAGYLHSSTLTSPPPPGNPPSKTLHLRVSRPGLTASDRCYEGRVICSLGHGGAALRVVQASKGHTPASKRVRKRSMRVDGIDSENAGVDEQESRPPAFQIIILVRERNFSNIRCLF